MSSEHVQAVTAALAAAQKEAVRAQQALKEASRLAVHIPMYDRLGKIITELRNMLIEAGKLPL